MCTDVRRAVSGAENIVVWSRRWALDEDGKKKARPAPRILVGGLLKHNSRLSLPELPPKRTHLPALFPIRQRNQYFERQQAFS